jgi:uncharacterized protein YjbI with pentapeptide repeats
MHKIDHFASSKIIFLGLAVLFLAILACSAHYPTSIEAEEVLTGANLSNTLLHQANLQNTDLRQATLEDADLRFAALTGALVNQDQLENAILGSTVLRTIHSPKDCLGVTPGTGNTVNE